VGADVYRPLDRGYRSVHRGRAVADARTSQWPYLGGAPAYEGVGAVVAGTASRRDDQLVGAARRLGDRRRSRNLSGRPLLAEKSFRQHVELNEECLLG